MAATEMRNIKYGVILSSFSARTRFSSWTYNCHQSEVQHRPDWVAEVRWYFAHNKRACFGRGVPSVLNMG